MFLAFFGSFETSIVKWSVEKGSECCSGTPIGSHASEGFYEQNEGQWKLVDVVDVSFEDAKERFCN